MRLLLVLVVLARLLTPADFGLVAAALVVIGFSAIFSEFGIGPALVQRLDLQTRHIRTGFTLSLCLGVLLMGLTWLAAPLLAGLFQLDELTPILRTLALMFPVQSLGVVAESLLLRELRFRCLALVDIVAVVLGYGAVGITMAMHGYGAWALVGAHLAQMGLRTALLLASRPHPAWPLIQRRACAELMDFGGGFTAGRLSNYLAGQGEHFVIGCCLGPVALGIYGRAYHLMAGPAVLFGNVLDRVMFPAMVQVQDQPRRLADSYRRGSALVALAMLPVSAVLVILAPEVVDVVLGADWHAVTLPLQLLGLGMLFRTGCKISDSLVRATGAVYRRTWRQTAYAILVVTGAWLGQHWGIAGVAIAVVATLAINFFLMAQLGLQLAAMSWRTFAAAHLPGCGLAALASIAVAATAMPLRACDFSPMLILVVSAVALLPVLVVAHALPGIFLGRDGQWMARKLKVFCFGNSPAPVTAHANETVTLAAMDRHPLALLAQAFAAERIRYCRWKSHLDLSRVLSGQGDLDLLVDRNDVDALLRVAEQLGFKQVKSCFEPANAHERHLYGLDPATGTLLHLHVHSSLFGKDHAFAALVPSLEELVLRHCTPDIGAGLLEGMPVVQPRAELILFVLCTLDHYSRLGQLPRLATKGPTLQAKLDALLAADSSQSWRTLLAVWLPSLPPALFAQCLATLCVPTSGLCRFILARRLMRQLGHGGFALPRLNVARLRSLLGAAWWRLGHDRGSPKQLIRGGAVIAIVGPDASGKSTMVGEAAQWLGNVFRVQTAHLGKPPSAWLTLVPNLLLRFMRVVTPQLRTSRHDAAVEAGTTSGDPPLLYALRRYPRLGPAGVRGAASARCCTRVDRRMRSLSLADRRCARRRASQLPLTGACGHGWWPAWRVLSSVSTARFRAPTWWCI